MSPVVHILSDARGIYIPRDFLTDDYNDVAWDHCARWGLTKDNAEHWIDAVNPDSEWYWDAWDWILNNAKYVYEKTGDVFTLYQDGDLWGICFDRMSDEEKRNFGFEE